MAVENITLNLIPTGDTPSIHVAQFDVDRPFTVTLKEGEDDFTPTGYTIELQVRKVDNNIVTSVPSQSSGNVITFNTTEQMTACSGTNLAELQLTKDSQTFATLHFYLVVQRDVLAGGVTSESDIYNLTEQIAEIVPEVIGDDYYNKEEVDEKIAEIPTFDPTNYYDKSETDTLLDDKANVSDLPDMTNYYDKSETDTLLDDKANVSDLPDMTDYYTKSEVDTKITDLYQIKTASGSIVHITDGGNAIPVKSLVSQIVAVESGNGQPKSPTNPYSISGFDNGVVSVCGVNIWDEQWRIDAGQFKALNLIPVKPNTTYYFKIPYAPTAYAYDKDRNPLGSMYIAKNTTFTTGANQYYMWFSLLESMYGSTYNHDISINYPSSDTQYHAYNGNTYTFAFGQTVYGGHFDNKGNLVVTYSIVDLGTITFGDAGNNIFGGKIIGMKQPQTTSDRNKGILCSNYPVSVVTQINQNMDDKSILRNGDNVYIRNTDYNTVSDFQNSINGVMLVYELATPTTLSITSQDILTLLGENNIFSNCGDVEVDYFTSKSDGIAELIKVFM